MKQEKRSFEQTILNFSQVLVSTLNLDKLVKLLLDRSMDILDADSGSLMMFEEGKRLVIRAFNGLDKKIAKKVALNIGERIAGWVIREKKPLLLIDGLKNDPRFAHLDAREEISSSLSIPLLTGKKVLGVLNLNRITNRIYFTEENLKFSTILSNMAATAIDNAIIHEDMRKRVEERTKELEESRDYVDNIIKSMIDTLIVVAPDGKIKTINEATSDLLGYKEEELIDKPIATIFAEEEEEEEEEEMPFKGTRMKKLIEEGSIRDYEMTYRTKSGEKILVSFSGSVMRDKEGKLVGIVGVARDIREIKRLMEKERELAAAAAAVAETDRKRAAELEKAYKELKETQAQLFQTSKLATLGEMSAGLAHEMNQPLGATSLVAKNFRKLVERGKLSKEEIESGLKDIEASVRRMSKIIQHIRTFARQDTLEFIQVDVNETIDSALSLLGEQLRLHEIEVIRGFSPALPKIMGEPYQLEQVWINLIVNARDAVDEREKQISDGRLQITDHKKSLNISTTYSPESKIVKVNVSDNGIGMSKEVKEKAFEPFFTTKEVDKATGLGLSISYGIIESHKGKIEVESKEGEGTEVRVILPVGGE